MPQIEYESVRKRTLSSAKLIELPHSTNITIFYLIKRSFLFWLPHLVIIALFLVYNLLGAAILNEIETANPTSSSSSSSTFRDLKKDTTTTKNVLIEKYESEISEKSRINDNLFVVLKQHTEKTFSNMEYFYSQVEQTIHDKLNLTRQSSESSSRDDSQGLDKEDLETFAFFSRLYAKHKANMNIEKMFKAIAKHMVEFKARLKANLTHGIKEAVAELGSHQLRLNQELDKQLKTRSQLIGGANSMDSAQLQQDNWKFSNYAYFIGSYLTTIGYGSISPKTIIGKLFTMIYLIFGLPLTLILLADLGSLITRLIKFTSTFTYTIYCEGYYENLKSRLAKRQRALIDKLKSTAAKNKNYKKRDKDDGSGSSDENSDDEDNANKYVNETSLWRMFLELGYRCMQQTNDEFDLSLGASIAFVIVYLTMGATLISRMSNCSFFNGYYSSLITLTKISYGDLLYNAENNEAQFTLFLAVYCLLGMAFIDLTVLSLQEKMRVLLIKNARNILNELVKFANQLGYSSWTMDSINLENLGKNSIHKIFYRGPGIGQTLLDQDPDDVFYHASSLKRGTSQKSALKSGKKKGHIDYHEISKCDKQTQITTLLCTKFKYGRQDSVSNTNLSTGLSSSLGSIPESVVSMMEEERKNMLVQPEITSHQDQINKASIEVFHKDGNGNGSSKVVPRRNRFASTNADLSNSVAYQNK